MTTHEIVTVPAPVLRRKAHKVEKVDKEVQTLLEDMVETLRNSPTPGVGLAAPQIGISQRLIVVEFGDEDDDEAPKKLYTVVNPEIISFSTETETGLEGCLSVPELVGEVERYLNIVVKGLNRFGKPTKIKASGWMARIFQHEIDHLDGILFTDRATKVWKPRDEEEERISQE